MTLNLSASSLGNQPLSHNRPGFDRSIPRVYLHRHRYAVILRPVQDQYKLVFYSCSGEFRRPFFSYLQ
ncbi:unnamed protein product [Periconia digitata]|uniref:Uncharacterized protein n=1 Tax=Periconia digitata TaxID=1303443 RepID=A0A9W4UD66_9PLEO|nr:unnamed protein product [Periconia digitata]